MGNSYNNEKCCCGLVKVDEIGVRGRIVEKGSRNANSIQTRFLEKITLQIDDTKGEEWRKE